MQVTEETWYDAEKMPPVSLYIGGRDQLVDGQKLVDRLKTVEKNVLLIRSQIDEDYEHLDCIWSMDCIDRVGRNVRDDIWSTISKDEEDIITPEGCHSGDKGKLIQRKEYHRE